VIQSKVSRVLLGLVALSAAGCSDDDANQGTEPATSDAPFEATVVRTTYGIPHITANDFGGLGYGAGYAYAQDNYCVLMREIVSASGQTAKYFGESEGNVDADFVYSFVNSDEIIRSDFLAVVPPDLQALVKGYAAGLNRYLEETGIDGLAEGPEGCRGAEWVRPVTDVDVSKRLRKLILTAGTEQLMSLVVAAADAAPLQSASLSGSVIESTPFDMSALTMPPPEVMGSNAYAIGADGSQTGHAMLLGNPHFPWQGSERFYVQHLTVPGQYDVMGASLQGVPLINVGFNKDVAWTHTVSTAQRFSLFELHLVKGDPYKYEFDGETRSIEANPVTIEVKLEDGTVEKRTKNIYTSHFGPIIELSALSDLVGGWPTGSGTVFSFKDANLDNTRILTQFLSMGQAGSIDEFETALRQVGLPWVNTIAADRSGTGYYADVSTVPHVTQDKLNDCSSGLVTQMITNQGIAALDGSRSECEWGTDSDGPAGLLGFDKLPKIRTSADVPYVGNANDSYWLSSPKHLLEGYSPLMGRTGFGPPEGIEQSLRTRLAFLQADERIAGTDGLGEGGFTLDLLQELMFGSRNMAAELVREDVVAICKGVTNWGEGDCPDGIGAYSENTTDAAEACTILENWDGLYNVDSVGPALWRNVWFAIDGVENLWSVPFDAADPVGTPNTLNTENTDVVEAVRCALGAGVDFLLDNSIPIDRPWGEVQFRWNGDGTKKIPIHGGRSGYMFSVISAGFVEDEGYSDITHGNSYIQTVTWDDTECPDAYAVLSYSQSTDPASDHYSDMTELYSQKGWNDMPFCEADIAAETLSTVTISTAD
jgi:acyl-homoserine-lactone acylase